MTCVLHQLTKNIIIIIAMNITKFTCEHEESNKLSFLDVLVEKTQTDYSIP